MSEPMFHVFTHMTDHDLLYEVDHRDPASDPPLRYAVQDLYTEQMQLRKHVVDHADCTAPTRQHELRMYM